MRSSSIGCDCNGKAIAVGAKVRVAKQLCSLEENNDFRRAFRKVAGRLFIVVGRDATAGVWIGIKRFEVLTIEPHLLCVVASTRNSSNSRRIFKRHSSGRATPAA